MIPDERLTAYALNETDAAETVAIEAYLRETPAAQAQVATLRALGSQLAATLAAEAKPVLPAKRTEPWRKVVGFALAASVLVATGLGLYSAQRQTQDIGRFAGVQDRSERESQRKNLREDYFGAVKDSDPEPADQRKNTHRLPLDAAAKSQTDKLAAAPPRPVAAGAPILPPISVTGGTMTAARRADHESLADAPMLAGVKEAAKAVNGEKGEARPVVGIRLNNNRADEGSALSGAGGNDRFPVLVENAFIKVEGQAALSTFGADVDTASYSIVRKYLSQNTLPPPGAVRLEEMVNYFPYRDAPPSGDEPFAVTVEVAECPWQPKHRLARIGLKAKPIDYKNRPATNLVFLVDVSGSMDEPNKLPLVKKSLKLLVDQLGENDRVALVVYASGTGVVLPSTSARNKPAILAALDNLKAQGSTNGAGGIDLAYQVALEKDNFIDGGVNRVILCTDGDWNVGATSTDALLKIIEEKRKSNVFLSVCGFGMGNLRDELMVQLAGKGNGQYYYIDSNREARKAFVEQLGGTLVTVAKDVKLQVEFNPAKVGAYRQLGYEKRQLSAQDFNDDTKDAGEMGAGQVVTVLYELAPADSTVAAGLDGLRYQSAALKKNDSNEAFTVKLRHKPPTGDVSTLREVPVADSVKPYGEASEDFRFAAAVASYAMLLRDSAHKGNATFAMVSELAAAAKTWDPGAYRVEFVELANKAKLVSGKP